MNRNLFIIFLLLAACMPDPPVADPGPLDLGKTVAIGGGMMAGFTDGVLCRYGQEHSIPKLITDAFAMAGGGAFTQALMPDDNGLGPAKDWENFYFQRAYLGTMVDCKNDSSFGPLRDTLFTGEESAYLQAVTGAVDNLSVNTLLLNEYDDPALSDIYYNRFASGNKSILDMALSRNAGMLLLWPGFDEVFNYALNGGHAVSLPDAAAFENRLDSILTALGANGAKGAIANVPDFRKFPFFHLVPYNGAVLTQSQADSLNDLYVNSGITHISFHTDSNAFVIEDVNAIAGHRQLESGEYILLNVPLDSMKCSYYGLVGAIINDRYALDHGEITLLADMTVQYNRVIDKLAAKHDLALVDMYSYFNKVAAGTVVDGVDYNGDFVTGGFFSLDAIHPTAKGNVLLANEWIAAINRHYGSGIPWVQCPGCDGVFFPD